MTRHFNSLGAFAVHLLERNVAIAGALELGLHRVARIVEVTAKREIGTYQEEAGPFPAWPQLADSTEDRKAAMGYPEDAPLFATGEMQASVSHQVEGLVAVIGSPDEKLVFHEFGTPNMPARPVMGPAGYRNREIIQKLVGGALLAGFIGAEQVHAALGYDLKTKD